MESAQRYMRQPEFGVLIKSNSNDMGLMIFSEVFYILGKGTYGKCYIGKLCNNQGEELEEDLDDLLESSRVVAIKVIPKSMNENESQQNKNDRRKRYEQEITNLAKLHKNSDINCTNVVKIYPFQMESNSNYYIVMQYCHHSNLSELVRLRKSKKAKITIFEFVQILLDLICGYTALKNNKILHNDLKPQNIFIKNKVFKIGDFGMSHSLKKLKECRSLGSINYMSPESLINEVINHKSDIYSLGILLYELMYGDHPYIQNDKLRSFYEQKRKQEIEKELAQTKSLNIDSERKFSKEKQVSLKLKVVHEYLSYKKNKQLNHAYCLQTKRQQEKILKELANLVKKMIQFNSLDRPLIEEINAKIIALDLKRFVRREDIFPDLANYSKSQRQFQLQNITKQGFSLISKREIAETFDSGLSLNRTTSGLHADLRDRLRAATSITQLFNDIKQYLNQYRYNPSEQYEVELFKYMNTYCFYLNERQYHYVQLNKENMSKENVKQFQLQNLEKLIIINQQDNDYLEGQASIPLRISEIKAATDRYNGLFVKQKYKLYKVLQSCLMNRWVDSSTSRNIFLLVLLTKIINCEQKHWKTTCKGEIIEQLKKIRNLMHLIGKKNLQEQDRYAILKTINEFDNIYQFVWGIEE